MTEKQKEVFARYEAAINEMYEKKQFSAKNIIKKYRISSRISGVLSIQKVIEGSSKNGSEWIAGTPTKVMVRKAIDQMKALNREYNVRYNNQPADVDQPKPAVIHTFTEQSAIETLKNSEKYIYKITRTLKPTWEDVL